MWGARLSLPLLGLLLSACSFSPPPAAGIERTSNDRTVRVIRAGRGDITGVLVYSGDLRAKPGLIVSPRVTGRLERLYVEPGSVVREGDTLAELDRSALEVQVVQNQASLAAAEARLAGLQAGDEPDARAEAEARLRAARARLAVLENSPQAEAIPQLLENLREARRWLADLENQNANPATQIEARLTAARSRLDQLLTANSPQGGGAFPQVDRLAVEQVRAEIQRAEEDLARARRPVTSEEIAAARLQVAQAEEELMLARNPVGPLELEEARANVEAAEHRLRQAGATASPAAVKAAESAVQYAWAALELSRLQLREAVITAPVGGIVAETYQRQGLPAVAGAPIVSIQPPEYELVLPVEDRQLGQVYVNQGVNVVVDAYPGESFTGLIKSIAPSVDPRHRTVAVKVEVVDPRMKLKAGLFAQAALTGQRRQNTLLLPREAVLTGPEASVMLVADGRAQRRPVQLGVGDGRNVEILQGVAEGAEVVVPAAGVMDGDLIAERAP